MQLWAFLLLFMSPSLWLPASEMLELRGGRGFVGGGGHALHGGERCRLRRGGCSHLIQHPPRLAISTKV